MSAAPPERLRILHTESSKGWGGQEIRVLSEARGVASRGHSVALAAPADARILAEASRYGVPAMALPIGRKDPRGFLALRAHLGRATYDIVNTHSSTDSWLAALACATRSRAPALVRTRHISAPAARNAATRWLYTRAACRIVTTGERLRAQVIAETGADPARVTSIPTGIDLERFRPGAREAARERLGFAPDAPLIGIVATLRSWKGHRDLLEAIAGLDAAVQLAIVGDGPQRSALEARAAELGIAARVRFAGDQGDPAPWMQAFDVFCLPSYANEGVPQALMQAMACGLPVVTTPVGSIEEIVSDGDTGVLVTARDPSRLREALAALLADPARRDALGNRARAEALERFSDSTMIDRMLEVFRAAVGEAHG